ncbi:hypothetical protein AVEN_57615-1 [Araneus ventricosus]|uniref:Uncharacterized protein n=1 Tax=Araneus ventricosus TaxID=182803 RepID=A0A4Y2LTL9_ARAVE|nr:hypothetical protein AVEN_57615-1 [Araneus ventricosus]
MLVFGLHQWRIQDLGPPARPGIKVLYRRYECEILWLTYTSFSATRLNLKTCGYPEQPHALRDVPALVAFSYTGVSATKLNLKKCGYPEQPHALRDVGLIGPHVFRAAVLEGLNQSLPVSGVFLAAGVLATPFMVFLCEDHIPIKQ